MLNNERRPSRVNKRYPSRTGGTLRKSFPRFTGSTHTRAGKDPSRVPFGKPVPALLPTADTQAYPVLLQEAERLDDWGLVADLERYHECEVRASCLSNEIATLQAEENYVLQKIRLSHYRLARADAGLQLACCEGLDPDFQQDYPEGRPGGYPIRWGKKFKGQGRPFVK